jgi:hypothetical protein
MLLVTIAVVRLGLERIGFMYSVGPCLKQVKRLVGEIPSLDVERIVGRSLTFTECTLEVSLFSLAPT